MEDKESILRKIRNLIEKSQHNGCTEEEALSAAMKVGEMMNKYNVTMNEVQFSNEEFTTYEVQLNTKRTNFMVHVIMSIAKFADTKCWMSRSDGSVSKMGDRKYCFFGTAKDVMIVEYIYKVLESAINNETNKYIDGDEYKNSAYHGKTKIANFICGITNRLCRRLEEMKEDILKENEQADVDYTSDINEESSIIVYDKYEIVEKKFKEKLNLKLKTSYTSRKIKDKSSYESGISAGDNVNINRAIAGSARSGQKMIS